jgi:two-component system chemotaxis response regulator CheB
MIVEDSRVVLSFLEHVIGADPRLEVAASAASAEEALRLLPKVAPDVISMDVRLPGMDGLAATRQIMREHPTPIVIVAASVATDAPTISTNALRSGALAVLEKPAGNKCRDYEAMAERLCTQLALMSQVKVVRQRIRRAELCAQPGSELPGKAALGGRGDLVRASHFRLVGMVASTGGPAALEKLLGRLNPRFPLPIGLVQHMSAGFLPGFVSWLEGACALRVAIAEDGQRPLPGTVYVAPSDRHLCLQGDRWRLESGEPVCSQLPSGTVLLRSLARSLRSDALGVLLTGMGDDGAAGLKELFDAGGHTIAEDESTAAVYGMPAAAVRLGGVSESLPLDRIGARLEALTANSTEVLR